MDSFDHFYQQLHSEQLLNRHGKDLVADARDIPSKTPDARVAGLITRPDSRDAEPVREWSPAGYCAITSSLIVHRVVKGHGRLLCPRSPLGNHQIAVDLLLQAELPMFMQKHECHQERHP